MKKNRKSCKPRTVAQIRNWNKRLISCYTTGYQAMLAKFSAGLTSREQANIQAMITTGKILLENWPRTVKDDKS
jgi:hypothetical protein